MADDLGELVPEDLMEWPFSSFDALDWAEAFNKLYPEMPVEIMTRWFANALMRGMKECQDGR